MQSSMNTRKLRSSIAAVLAVVFVACLIVSGCQFSDADLAQFVERTVTVNGHEYPFRVYVPARYTRLRRWPIILYLHGSAERGRDNMLQLTTGIGPALVKYDELYSCIVVMPQCREGEEWYGEEEQQAIAALQQSMREFRVDPRRVYLTGVSMGGTGTWYMARHRSLFAAIVPLCGEVVRDGDDPFPSDPPPDIARIAGAANPFQTLATAIGSTPVWAFHGADDDVVSPQQSRQMVAALRAARGNVRYTEYPGVGHNCWDLAYADREMIAWLFAQHN
jgi:predicted peptidase